VNQFVLDNIGTTMEGLLQIKSKYLFQRKEGGGHQQNRYVNWKEKCARYGSLTCISVCDQELYWVWV